MKRTITGMALVLALALTTTAWSQEPPMERRQMEKGESPHMESCMQMMGEMETTDAALEELVGRMQAADGEEKLAAMEEVLTALVTQRREMHKRMRNRPKRMCRGMMPMMME